MPILEIVSVGNSVKVTAIDEKSGVEACIIAPQNTSRSEMEKLAIQKLEYVLKKKLKESEDGSGFVV